MQLQGIERYRGPRYAFVATGLLLLFANSLSAEVIYVDHEAYGNQNGESWSNAYTDLTTALAAGGSGDEIRVADGVYKPSLGSFHIVSGLRMNGGYAGIGSCDPNVRDINAYETILSCDLKGDDTLNGDDTPDFLNHEDNCRHVLFAEGTTEGTVVDGFTVMGGNAREPTPRGGGLRLYNAELLVKDCLFTGNLAYQTGGGIGLVATSALSLVDCVLEYNAAYYGGGLGTKDSASADITNCVFADNEGWHPDQGSGYGGGMWALTNQPITITNTIFARNTASQGGAIHKSGTGKLELINSTIVKNIATDRYGGLICGSDTAIFNTIIYFNRDSNTHAIGSQLLVLSDTTEVAYSNVEGGDDWDWPNGGTVEWGDGYIVADPSFIDVESNYQLQSGSSCIDAGNNELAPTSPTDLAGHPRFYDDPLTKDTGQGTAPIVDMGAYEYQGGSCTPGEALAPPLADDRFDVNGTVRCCVNDASCKSGVVGPNAQTVCRDDATGQGKVCYVARNRYLSVKPNPLNAGEVYALRISVDYETAGRIVLGYAAKEEQDVSAVGPGPNLFHLARVSTSPDFRDWTMLSEGYVTIGDCEISPGHNYIVEAIREGCIECSTCFSAELELPTVTNHADVTGGGSPGDPPNGKTATLVDVSAIVRGFENTQNEPKDWLDVEPCTGDAVPNLVINLADALEAIRAFQTEPYPGPLPEDCP